MGGVFILIYLVGFLGFGILLVNAISEHGGLKSLIHEYEQASHRTAPESVVKWILLVALIFWPVALIGLFVSNMTGPHER